MRYDRPAPLTADRMLVRKSIVMLCRAETAAAVTVPQLPEGFSFRTYRPGDARAWGELMARVAEFDEASEGEAAFHRAFMDDEAALAERNVYVTAPSGEVAATSTAWWFEEDGVRYGRVHWVAADPKYQNMGLGRAVVSWTMNRLSRLEPGADQYLDTQTWSHKAIGLYMRLGFRPVRESHPVLQRVNEYSEALAILRGVLPKESLRQFEEEALD